MEHKNRPKFRVATLGCRTNQYESQAFRDQLLQMGYEQAGDGEQADLCIVNTCTVTESADIKSRQEIRQFTRENPGARIVATGCSAERAPEKIKEIEGVTDLIQNRDKERLLEVLFPEAEIPEFAIKQFEAHTRAFVKVQDGCDSFCTYCILPYVRGRSRSRTIEEVVHEVEGLIENGFLEIVLTGINIGDFDGGVEPKKRLSDLVRIVDQVPGLKRLRISSIDPDEVDDDLADAVLHGKTTCKSLHLVLQSGSNVILKRMNRKYTRQVFMEAVERLKAAYPDFTFTTDVIVGFPGETDIDFEETLNVIREVKFAKVHMFPYSPRPRTRAALYPNQIPQEMIRERKQEILRLSEETAFELRQHYLGRKAIVLTESREAGTPKIISGHTENFLNVLIESEELQPNQLAEVRLFGNTPAGLLGDLISVSSKPIPLLRAS